MGLRDASASKNALLENDGFPKLKLGLGLHFDLQYYTWRQIHYEAINSKGYKH